MFLLWTGNKNTTHGSANPKTGKRSFYGTFRRFKTKEDRQWFVDHCVVYSDVDHHICNEKTGRKFDLGCSVAVYKESLNILEYFVCSDSKPVIYQR